MSCGGGDSQGGSYPPQEGLQQVGPPGGSPASHTLSHLPCGNHRGLPGQLRTQDLGTKHHIVVRCGGMQTAASDHAPCALGPLPHLWLVHLQLGGAERL